LKAFKVLLKILGFALAAAFAVVVTTIIVLGVSFHNVFPVERTKTTYTSPDGTHECTVRTTTGGLLTPMQVVAKVESPGILGSRTIYRVTRIDEASVFWLDDRTVWINGVSLDIYQDKYVSEIARLSVP
jgi:hypothetical protein